MTITLAFYKGTKAENPNARAFDRLVCAWPGSAGRFSHTELVEWRTGQFGGCWSSSARDGGVRPKTIDLASGRWVLVVLPGYDLAAAVKWFMAHIGARYDYPGILGYVVPFIKQMRDWLYCSESAASAIVAAASALGLPVPPDTHLSPNALFAWCLEQPGVQVFEIPALEPAYA